MAVAKRYVNYGFLLNMAMNLKYQMSVIVPTEGSEDLQIDARVGIAHSSSLRLFGVSDSRHPMSLHTSTLSSSSPTSANWTGLEKTG